MNLKTAPKKGAVKSGKYADELHGVDRYLMQAGDKHALPNARC
jgi:hypothetical protein